MKKTIYTISLVITAIILYVIVGYSTYINHYSVNKKAVYLETNEVITSDDLLTLEDNYSVEQITLFKELYDTNMVDDLRAVSYNFVENGTYAYNPYLQKYIPQELELLVGETWDKDTKEFVIIIDEATALERFDTIEEAIGQKIYIDLICFDIIGVVSNTTYREQEVEYYSEVLDTEIDIINFSKNVYIPYSFSGYDFDTDTFYDTLLPTAVIVKSDGIIDTFKIEKNIHGIMDIDTVSSNSVYLDNLTIFSVVIELAIIFGMIYWSSKLFNRYQNSKVGVRKNYGANKIRK